MWGGGGVVERKVSSDEKVRKVKRKRQMVSSFSTRDEFFLTECLTSFGSAKRYFVEEHLAYPSLRLRPRHLHLRTS